MNLQNEVGRKMLNRVTCEHKFLLVQFGYTSPYEISSGTYSKPRNRIGVQMKKTRSKSIEGISWNKTGGRKSVSSIFCKLEVTQTIRYVMKEKVKQRSFGCSSISLCEPDLSDC